MNVAVLESRPLYGIGTVARLTGIRPETLRIWERRYGLGATQKADNGRRMYTQIDLEHLQIVSRLVDQGFRIGEIANKERKTLEALLEQNGGEAVLSARRPSALIIGQDLCHWLDQHPGCLSGLSANLLRCSVEDTPLNQLPAEKVELLIVECGALAETQLQDLQKLKDKVEPSVSLLFYEFAGKQVLSRLQEMGVASCRLPLTTENFAVEIRQLMSQLEVERGVHDAGELVAPRARLFSDAELSEHRRETSVLACGCSGHLSEIIGSLANFEEYSASCSVENWSDAATHSVVFAYTSQARWLMEKALQAVLEEHSSNHHNK